MNSIDKDIEQTLNKLNILLEYSTATASQEIHLLIIKAIEMWDSSKED